jgi:hypothetical protein
MRGITERNLKMHQLDHRHPYEAHPTYAADTAHMIFPALSRLGLKLIHTNMPVTFRRLLNFSAAAFLLRIPLRLVHINREGANGFSLPLQS